MQGYAAVDLASSLFQVCKAAPLPDAQKLGFIKEIGMTHMRVADGCDSLLQLTGYVLCGHITHILHNLVIMSILDYVHSSH